MDCSVGGIVTSGGQLAGSRQAIMVSGILSMETVYVCVCWSVGLFVVTMRVVVCVAYFKDNTVSSETSLGQVLFLVTKLLYNKVILS